MTAANLAWAAEFALESVGAYLFFRRRLFLLTVWLGLRAVADLVGMVLFFSGHDYAYTWEDYIQRTIQYVLLAAVNLYVASRITGERRYTWFWPLTFSLIVAVGIAHAHALTASVLRLEMAVGVVLSGIVAFAMGLVNGRAPEPWGKVAIGLVILGGTDALLAYFQWHGYHSQPYYPVGAIVALGVLLVAGWKDYRLEEFRQALPAKVNPEEFLDAASKMEYEGPGKKEPQNVRLTAADEKWLREFGARA